MRVFKTKWFHKEARAHAIRDDELCKAVEAVMQGKADDLGGVYTKSALIRIATAPSSWQKVASTGFTLSCMPNRTYPISTLAS